MESTTSLEKLALIELLKAHDVLDTHGMDIINALSVDFISSNLNNLIKSLEERSTLYHIVLLHDDGYHKFLNIFKHIQAQKAKEYILNKIQRNLKKYPDSQFREFLIKKFKTSDLNDIIALSPTKFLNSCIGCISLYRGDDIYICKTQDELDLYILKMNNDHTEIVFSDDIED